VPSVAASDPHNLQRFIDAQLGLFESAIAELRAGSKQSHWMWFIFPQLAGLGRSATSQFYGLASLDEARAYLDHAQLGPRLKQAVEAVITWAGKRSAEQILGPVDAMKLRSSLTLFDQAAPNDLFADALAGLFDGRADERTLALLAPKQ
jgi:uncharacterized protein (DUF1810 family)